MSFLKHIRQFVKRLPLAFAIAFCFSALLSESIQAQRPRFPDPFQVNQVPAQNVQFQAPSSTPPSLTTPNFGTPSIINSPPATLQTPNFVQPQGVIQSPGTITAPVYDPFQTNNSPLPDFGSQFQLPGQTQPVIIQPPPEVLQSPQYQQQVLPGYGTQQFGTPNARNWWPSAEWPSQAWTNLRENVIPRLIEKPRFRHTYITGNGGNQLGENVTEIATTVTFANFLRGTQPLRISPGFDFIFWSGPDTALTGADLPAQAYSAYLSADFITNPNFTGGMEANIAVGFYSDFKAASSDSVRVTGTILGWQRINSYTTGKLGIEYYDRVDLKLLPAIGVYMNPIADLKFDIYFPRPKLAQRLPNVGNYEIWSYIGAEYGGGSWTIERLAGFNDQVDVNEVYSFIGAEWMGPRNVTGFVELGYAFNRELVYRSDDKNPTELQDAIMVRAGLAF